MLAGNAQERLPAAMLMTGQGGQHLQLRGAPPAFGPPVARCKHDGGAPLQEQWLTRETLYVRGLLEAHLGVNLGIAIGPLGVGHAGAGREEQHAAHSAGIVGRVWGLLGAGVGVRGCRDSAVSPWLQGQWCDAAHYTVLCLHQVLCYQPAAAKCCRAQLTLLQPKLATSVGLAHPAAASAGPTDAGTASCHAMHTAYAACCSTLPLDQQPQTANSACLADLHPVRGCSLPTPG